MSAKKDNGVNIETLWFYFDSIERDCMDLGMLDRKSSQVQALKGKLLRLPTLQFEAAMKTIEKLVEGGDGAKIAQTERETTRKKMSVELFERTASAGDVKDVKSTVAVTR